MTFKSKRVQPDGPGRFKMIGDLTMHGVTKEVTLNVEGPSPAMKQGQALPQGLRRRRRQSTRLRATVQPDDGCHAGRRRRNRGAN